MSKHKLQNEHSGELPLEELPLNVLQDRLSFLFRYGVVYFWAHALSGVLLCAILSSQLIDKVLLGIWLATLILFAALRWVVSSRFSFGSDGGRERLQQVSHRFLLLSTVLNALWGVSGIILFSSDPLVLSLHIALLLLAAVASLSLLSIFRNGFYLQIAAVLLPLAFMLLLQPETQLQLLSVAVLAVGGMLAMMGHVLSSRFHELQDAQLRLMEQVHTDPLIQLSNRRYFEQAFKLEWRRAARVGEPLALLMLDIDQFRRFNDQHGQEAGDQCLRVVAQCLTKVVRRSADLVARHGGEEFALLLPNTGLDDAVQLAEKLRHSVEAKCLRHSDNALPRILTVSIGVSCCVPLALRAEGAGSQQDVVYPAMLLNAADRALHRAKRNGRNQVAVEYAGAELFEPPAVKGFSI